MYLQTVLLDLVRRKQYRSGAHTLFLLLKKRKTQQKGALHTVFVRYGKDGSLDPIVSYVHGHLQRNPDSYNLF
jgi:hypothetical protein